MLTNFRPRQHGRAVGALVIAAALATGPAAFAQMMGMPGLDASKPIGAAPAPSASPGGGEGRPATFSAAQVERGRLAYSANCLDCHGDELDNGEFGGAPLRGSYFEERWFGMTVDGLFAYIDAAMPPQAPGSLSDQAYVDIIAFILSKNHMNSGGTELPNDQDALAGLTIGN